MKTVQILFPLLLSTLSSKAVDEILRLVRDEKEFGTRYIVLIISKAEREYNPVANTLLLWRSSVWGFTN